ncbi:sodium transporter [Alteromonas aestuariivivens]|uniref:Sodium transporter n=1 Tax=Alteromonas aestuariivivens TaxID=1938339 RepID=A0A3D8MC12_9ALTE|nr:sodium/solute symporter [Alteromonas aestuariivivens]RDV28044.1 sodium transporter [Alteromonas aestuariivivens]
MTLLDYLIIATYLLLLLGMGVAFRHQSNKQDYFLGGRSLAWPALTLSVMATQLSAVSFISAPAFVGLREGGGLIWLSYELALPIAVALMLWRLLPTLHKAGVVSVYDYLEQRFSRSTRLLISLVFQISRSFATAIMIYAIALILQGTMGLAQWHSILAIGVITLIYSAMGGMKAVVYGDALQMILILLGAAVCLWVGLDAMGGWHQVLQKVDGNRLLAVNTSSAGLHGNDFGLLPMLFGGIVLYASYYGCDQSEAQRSLSSGSISDLKKMLMAVALVRFPVTLLYCLSGLVIGTLVLTTPELQAKIPANQPDWMMPVFITEYLPTGIIGILVVAILAAAMSSLSSAINSLAAVSVEDWYRLRQITPDNHSYLKLARLAGVAWGLITLVLSLYAGDIAPTVIEAINKIGSVFYGPVLATFLAGIHTRFVSPGAANIGLAAGVMVNALLWLNASPIFWFWWNLIGFAVTLSTAIMASAALPNDQQHRLPSERGISMAQAMFLLGWSALLLILCVWLPNMILNMR